MSTTPGTSTLQDLAPNTLRQHAFFNLGVDRSGQKRHLIIGPPAAAQAAGIQERPAEPAVLPRRALPVVVAAAAAAAANAA